MDKLAEQGEIDAIDGMVDKVERLKQEKDELMRAAGVPNQCKLSFLRAREHSEPCKRHSRRHACNCVAANKVNRVCEICGAFLVAGDSEKRIQAHLEGKQHIGFWRLRETVKRFDTLRAEVAADDRKRRDGGSGKEDERRSGGSASSSSSTRKRRCVCVCLFVGEREREKICLLTLRATRSRSSSRGRDRDRDRDRERERERERDRERDRRRVSGTSSSSSSTRRRSRSRSRDKDRRVIEEGEVRK